MSEIKEELKPCPFCGVDFTHTLRYMRHDQTGTNIEHTGTNIEHNCRTNCWEEITSLKEKLKLAEEALQKIAYKDYFIAKHRKQSFYGLDENWPKVQMKEEK